MLVGNAGDDVLDGGNGNDAMIDGAGSDTARGGNGDDWFFAALPQLIGGSSTDVDQFDGGAGSDTVAVLVDPNSLAAEQANVQANFHPGQAFTFATMNLMVTGVEHIVLTTHPGFTDVALPGGDLGELLHKADLFGFI